MDEPAFFYAVEGVDGCGKTGITRALVDHLNDTGRRAILTREPGGTPQGEQIRALILSGSDDAWDANSELLLMTAARVEHVRRVILPALATGTSVVSDRYVGSTIAYQGAGRGMAEDFIRQLHRVAVGDLWPDLVIVLDLDPLIGLARSKGRLRAAAIDEGRFETLDLAFHQRIRQSYLDQAAAAPQRHVVVDASGTPDMVRRRTIDAVEAWQRGS
ncbi:dTMP kinase [Sphingomonas naasensis]|uniref:Thymidylate kinase n=1 Tax=Sphingomonas naasensis TaxID=1344951 RepID=A0A4S1WJ81_9SPHN|nr:dTMP kinase [Sphingomonas naasensis]NIJ20855.1 dTMP kinase [Sphingomonas naasensis]TGX43254.1 dTMP kinase [Sphingomonas naasensis]